MFSDSTKENVTGRLTIPDFSPDIVRLMLEYIYVGKFTAEMEHRSEELLRIADKVMPGVYFVMFFSSF